MRRGLAAASSAGAKSKRASFAVIRESKRRQSNDDKLRVMKNTDGLIGHVAHVQAPFRVIDTRTPTLPPGIDATRLPDDARTAMILPCVTQLKDVEPEPPPYSTIAVLTLCNKTTAPGADVTFTVADERWCDKFCAISSLAISACMLEGEVPPSTFDGIDLEALTPTMPKHVPPKPGSASASSAASESTPPTGGAGGRRGSFMLNSISE